MEHGHKVRRSHWNAGYWRIENGELIIHRWDGREINLRESIDMVYMLRNMSCDDWKIVEERADY